jgi:cytoskeletal protein CcmA (bactofilin family)
MTFSKKPAAIIEAGCRIEGNISFNGPAKISGNVTGSLYSNDTIVISEEAIIFADIQANIILVSGTVKGTIKADSRVEMRGPARFEGTIISPSLIVEEGVIFHGNTRMAD